MATGYPYQIIPIDADHGEIRLLRFAVGKSSPDAPLECSFKKISLHKSRRPNYYAVSYTWGNQDVRKEIIVDGHKVSVPENTESALRRLCRHKDKDKSRRISLGFRRDILLWIDAVCINQASPSERSLQVAMMGLVYSSAAEVLIWLGSGGDGAYESIAVVKKVFDHCRSQTNGLKELDDWIKFTDIDGRNVTRYGDIFQTAAVPGARWGRRGDRLPLADVEVECLQDFFSVPWFTRLWAIQEIILAKRATCYYGEHSIPARDVLTAASWLRHGYRFFSITAWRNMRGARCSVCIDIISQSCQTLPNIFLSSRDFECLDLRDKVYAILGLLSTEFRKEAGKYGEIEPNYERSLNEVWRDGTRAAMLSTSDIQLLRLAGADEFPAESRSKTRVFQSWVHNYQDGEGRAWFAVGYDYRWYIGEAQIDGKFPDPNVLAIKGTILDEVARVGTAYTDGDLFIEMKKHIHHELDWIGRSVDSRFASKPGESIEKAICSVLACGMTENDSPAQDDDEFYGSAASFVEFWKDCTAFAPENGLTEPRVGEEPFLNAFFSYSRRRKFFITESGRIGMGPGPTQEGDFVVQLFGCEIPFVLRKQGGYLTLLGDAYFHNLPDHIRQLQEFGHYPDSRYFYIK